MRPFLFILPLLFFLAGCRKTENAANTYFTVRNDLPAGANIRFYSNLYDKLQDRNPITTGFVAAGQSWEMPLATFPANQPVFADWYTDDFRYTNWMPGDSSGTFSYQQSGQSLSGSTLISLAQPAPLIARRLLMDGKGISTTWKAVARDYQPLPANEVYEVTFFREGFFRFNVNGTVSDGRYLVSETPENTGNSYVYLHVTLLIDQPVRTGASMVQGNNGGSVPPYGSDSLEMYQNGTSDQLLFVKVH